MQVHSELVFRRDSDNSAVVFLEFTEESEFCSYLIYEQWKRMGPTRLCRFRGVYRAGGGGGAGRGIQLTEGPGNALRVFFSKRSLRIFSCKWGGIRTFWACMPCPNASKGMALLARVRAAGTEREWASKLSFPRAFMQAARRRGGRLPPQRSRLQVGLHTPRYLVKKKSSPVYPASWVFVNFICSQVDS